MRYFEIAKPSARHILANAEQRDAAREPRSGKIETTGERGMKSVGSRRPAPQSYRTRKTYLIDRHVGRIYRPGVRNSAGEFSSSQPTAADPLFNGPTDDCRCLLPIGIRWIKRCHNRHERVSRVPNGDVEGEGQADIAHCHPDVVGDCVERLPDDVALCVEFRLSMPSCCSMVSIGLSSLGGGIYPRRYRLMVFGTNKGARYGRRDARTDYADCYGIYGRKAPLCGGCDRAIREPC